MPLRSSSTTIYITASVLGACTSVACDGLGVGRLPAPVVGFLVMFVVRSLATRLGMVPAGVWRIRRRERWKSQPKDSPSE
jgi:uncharacterized membrane protein YeiH